MAASAADEQLQTAPAKAVKTGFRKFELATVGYFETSAAALLAARYTFFSLYNIGPKKEPRTPLQKPFLYERTKTPA